MTYRNNTAACVTLRWSVARLDFGPVGLLRRLVGRRPAGPYAVRVVQPGGCLTFSRWAANGGSIRRACKRAGLTRVKGVA